MFYKNNVLVKLVILKLGELSKRHQWNSRG